MVSESEITEIQIHYPRIYMACHVEHVRAKSSEVKLSSRDSAILSHLSVSDFTTPSRLSKHLGISTATLSEAISKLVGLGYVRAERDQDDERKQRLSLKEKGLLAMKKTSVLDSKKVHALLAKLRPAERKKAIEGLSLLGNAALR